MFVMAAGAVSGHRRRTRMAADNWAILRKGRAAAETPERWVATDR